MTLRSTVAAFAGRSSYWFLHTFMKGGSSLPGKITTKIDPEILKHLGQNYDVIVITGTNGKTLTTALTVRVLKQKYSSILTNPTGSNMEQGIVTTFLRAPKVKGARPIAVLEVDEANVIKVTKYIKPKAFVFTNIFRDQMDRYGEIYTTYQKIIDGVALAPEATIIANGDAPIFHSKNLPNPIIYYGFKQQDETDMKAKPNTDGVLCPNCQHILHYRYLTYSNLGKYFCPNCGYKRPELKFAVTKVSDLTPTSSTFEVDGHPMKIEIGGLYNIYNALAAYAVGRFLGVTAEQIDAAFSEDKKVFGRQEVINLDGKQVTLILVKNPVGLNQVLDMIATDKKPFSFVGLLNANYADGIDTSWIWDGNFEKLAQLNIPAYITGGERYKDITFRLKVAGVPDDKHQVVPELKDVVEKIKTLPTEHVYVLATYTAVLQLRKLLADQGYIKEGMGA
ncbi:UDP-N-acetylmuramyl peptide synthase [Secundilactobacillus pentosiphilus]|uniref:Lipid II isoglutaminyl synthase (glutamine-hydrolyzing) subunit MurT n=1 Tax=Secundilactobacillus pentosiphilus TaxID=1714682 RepID=A0A1Z5IWS5_9LACO|nr:Mur ligase family protein [Secundilactobacillus pentosiphilus]GAX06213.1 UDP-N-acetylmuramyl peptide synthase [Secundilactobacillus pentosiphilus]